MSAGDSRERRRSVWADFELMRMEAGEPFDLERYVIGRLEQKFDAYPERVTAQTSILDLVAHSDFEGGELGWLGRLEQELAVTLAKGERTRLLDGDVRSLIGLLQRRLVNR